MFRKFVYNQLETIQHYKSSKSRIYTPVRNQIHVCVIDDEGFDIAGLAASGYTDVTWKEDYKNLNDFAGYDLIACDIDGIGKKISPDKGGLAVAEVLKTRYPDTIVLIYSGHNSREIPYQGADGYFSKSKEAHEIANEFDKYAARYWDPVAAWGWIEKKLRAGGIDNKTIAFVEDVYARSLEDNINLFKKRKFADILGIIKNVVDIVAVIASLIQ